MYPNYAQPATPSDKPEKEPAKEKTKPNTKPKDSPKKLAEKSQDNTSKLSNHPRNLALEPEKDPWTPPKNPRNLALEPEKDPWKSPKNPRNLALEPDNEELTPIKELKNLALPPDDEEFTPIKELKNLVLPPDNEDFTPVKELKTLALEPQKESSKLSKHPINLALGATEPNNLPTEKVPSKKKHQKLFNDGKKKECGKCHEIKPHEKFERRFDSRNGGRYYIRSTCKQCKLENKQIYALKNKYQVIKNIYNGKLGEKCERCNTGKDKLPALDFHHFNPKKKTNNWHDQMYKNWKDTKRTLEQEGVKILCKNCHHKENSTVYNKYEEVIQNIKIDLNETNKNLKQYVKNLLPNADHSILRLVGRHIKKRAVIEQVYGGKCVGCESITTKNNLPSLQFHHRNNKNEDKSKVWKNIHNLEIGEIKKELGAKDCISLCANCHRMVHSPHFEKNNEEIIGSDHSKEIYKYYEKVKENIKKFKIK